MKITAIEPQRLHPKRVNVHVDGVFRLRLSAELVLRERLRVGDEADQDGSQVIVNFRARG
jgi:hypothetical protein